MIDATVFLYNAEAAATADPSLTALQPAVAVTTLPLKRVADKSASGTQGAACDRSDRSHSQTVDVFALHQLFRAFPQTFMLLVTPADCAPLFAVDAADGAALLYDTPAHAFEAFLSRADVQMRCCQLSLAGSGEQKDATVTELAGDTLDRSTYTSRCVPFTSAVTDPAHARPHRLYVAPRYATALIQSYPWLATLQAGAGARGFLSVLEVTLHLLRLRVPASAGSRHSSLLRASRGSFLFTCASEAYHKLIQQAQWIAQGPSSPLSPHVADSTAERLQALLTAPDAHMGGDFSPHRYPARALHLHIVACASGALHDAALTCVLRAMMQELQRSAAARAGASAVLMLYRGYEWEDADSGRGGVRTTRAEGQLADAAQQAMTEIALSRPTPVADGQLGLEAKAEEQVFAAWSACGRELAAGHSMAHAEFVRRVAAGGLAAVHTAEDERIPAHEHVVVLLRACELAAARGAGLLNHLVGNAEFSGVTVSFGFLCEVAAEADGGVAAAGAAVALETATMAREDPYTREICSVTGGQSVVIPVERHDGLGAVLCAEGLEAMEALLFPVSAWSEYAHWQAQSAVEYSSAFGRRTGPSERPTQDAQLPALLPVTSLQSSVAQNSVHLSTVHSERELSAHTLPPSQSMDRDGEPLGSPHPQPTHRTDPARIMESPSAPRLAVELPQRTASSVPLPAGGHREAASYLPAPGLEWSVFGSASGADEEDRAPHRPAVVGSLSALCSAMLPAVSAGTRSTLLSVETFVDGDLSVKLAAPPPGAVQETQRARPSSECSTVVLLLSVNPITAHMHVLSVQSLQQQPQQQQPQQQQQQQQPQRETEDKTVRFLSLAKDSYFACVACGLAKAVTEHDENAWISPADVLWMDGVAFRTPPATLRHVRATPSLSAPTSSLTLSWSGECAVKVLVQPLAQCHAHSSPAAPSASLPTPSTTLLGQDDSASAQLSDAAEHRVIVGNGPQLTVDGLSPSTLYLLTAVLAPAPGASEASVGTARLHPRVAGLRTLTDTVRLSVVGLTSAAAVHTAPAVELLGASDTAASFRRMRAARQFGGGAARELPSYRLRLRCPPLAASIEQPPALSDVPRLPVDSPLEGPVADSCFFASIAFDVQCSVASRERLAGVADRPEVLELSLRAGETAALQVHQHLLVTSAYHPLGSVSRFTEDQRRPGAALYDATVHGGKWVVGPLPFVAREVLVDGVAETSANLSWWGSSRRYTVTARPLTVNGDSLPGETALYFACPQALADCASGVLHRSVEGRLRATTDDLHVCVDEASKCFEAAIALESLLPATRYSFTITCDDDNDEDSLLRLPLPASTETLGTVTGEFLTLPPPPSWTGHPTTRGAADAAGLTWATSGGTPHAYVSASFDAISAQLHLCVRRLVPVLTGETVVNDGAAAPVGPVARAKLVATVEPLRVSTEVSLDRLSSASCSNGNDVVERIVSCAPAVSHTGSVSRARDGVNRPDSRLPLVLTIVEESIQPGPLSPSLQADAGATVTVTRSKPLELFIVSDVRCAYDAKEQLVHLSWACASTASVEVFLNGVAAPQGAYREGGCAISLRFLAGVAADAQGAPAHSWRSPVRCELHGPRIVPLSNAMMLLPPPAPLTADCYSLHVYSTYADLLVRTAHWRAIQDAFTVARQDNEGEVAVAETAALGAGDAASSAVAVAAPAVAFTAVVQLPQGKELSLRLGKEAAGTHQSADALEGNAMGLDKSWSLPLVFERDCHAVVRVTVKATLVLDAIHAARDGHLSSPAILPLLPIAESEVVLLPVPPVLPVYNLHLRTVSAREAVIAWTAPSRAELVSGRSASLQGSRRLVTADTETLYEVSVVRGALGTGQRSPPSSGSAQRPTPPVSPDVDASDAEKGCGPSRGGRSRDGAGDAARFSLVATLTAEERAERLCVTGLQPATPYTIIVHGKRQVQYEEEVHPHSTVSGSVVLVSQLLLVTVAEVRCLPVLRPFLRSLRSHHKTIQYDVADALTDMASLQSRELTVVQGVFPATTAHTYRVYRCMALGHTQHSATRQGDADRRPESSTTSSCGVENGPANVCAVLQPMYVSVHVLYALSLVAPAGHVVKEWAVLPSPTPAAHTTSETVLRWREQRAAMAVEGHAGSAWCHVALSVLTEATCDHEPKTRIRRALSQLPVQTSALGPTVVMQRQHLQELFAVPRDGPRHALQHLRLDIIGDLTLTTERVRGGGGGGGMAGSKCLSWCSSGTRFKVSWVEVRFLSGTSRTAEAMPRQSCEVASESGHASVRFTETRDASFTAAQRVGFVSTVFCVSICSLDAISNVPVVAFVSVSAGAECARVVGRTAANASVLLPPDEVFLSRSARDADDGSAPAPLLRVQWSLLGRGARAAERAENSRASTATAWLRSVKSAREAQALDGASRTHRLRYVACRDDGTRAGDRAECTRAHEEPRGLDVVECSSRAQLPVVTAVAAVADPLDALWTRVARTLLDQYERNFSSELQWLSTEADCSCRLRLSFTSSLSSLVVHDFRPSLAAAGGTAALNVDFRDMAEIIQSADESLPYSFLRPASAPDEKQRYFTEDSVSASPAVAMSAPAVNAASAYTGPWCDMLLSWTSDDRAFIVTVTDITHQETERSDVCTNEEEVMTALGSMRVAGCTPAELASCLLQTQGHATALHFLVPTDTEDTRGTAGPTGGHPRTRFGAVVDGLRPEHLYRVCVSGANSGDTVLRAQFLTPPSPHGVHVHVRRSVQQRIEVAATMCDAHRDCASSAYDATALPEDSTCSPAPMLAPGIAFTSSSFLRVVDSDTADVLHESKATRARRGADPPLTTHLAFDMPSTAARAVRVQTVRALTVSYTDASAAARFLKESLWGPLQIQRAAVARAVGTPDAPPAKVLVAIEDHCCVPQVASMTDVRLVKRAARSLQLQWDWSLVHCASPSEEDSSCLCPAESRARCTHAVVRCHVLVEPVDTEDGSDPADQLATSAAALPPREHRQRVAAAAVATRDTADAAGRMRAHFEVAVDKLQPAKLYRIVVEDDAENGSTLDTSHPTRRPREPRVLPVSGTTRQHHGVSPQRLHDRARTESTVEGAARIVRLGAVQGNAICVTQTSETSKLRRARRLHMPCECGLRQQQPQQTSGDTLQITDELVDRGFVNARASARCEWFFVMTAPPSRRGPLRRERLADHDEQAPQQRAGHDGSTVMKVLSVLSYKARSHDAGRNAAYLVPAHTVMRYAAALIEPEGLLCVPTDVDRLISATLLAGAHAEAKNAWWQAAMRLALLTLPSHRRDTARVPESLVVVPLAPPGPAAAHTADPAQPAPSPLAALFTCLDNLLVAPRDHVPGRQRSVQLLQCVHLIPTADPHGGAVCFELVGGHLAVSLIGSAITVPPPPAPRPRPVCVVRCAEAALGFSSDSPPPSADEEISCEWHDSASEDAAPAAWESACDGVTVVERAAQSITLEWAWAAGPPLSQPDGGAPAAGHDAFRVEVALCERRRVRTLGPPGPSPAVPDRLPLYRENAVTRAEAVDLADPQALPTNSVRHNFHVTLDDLVANNCGGGEDGRDACSQRYRATLSLASQSSMTGLDGLVVSVAPESTDGSRAHSAGGEHGVGAVLYLPPVHVPRPVQRVTVICATATSLTVEWVAEGDDAAARAAARASAAVADAISYRVAYRLVRLDSPGQSEPISAVSAREDDRAPLRLQGGEVTVDGGQRSTVLRDLVPSTWYSVAVVAQNSIGEADSSCAPLLTARTQS